MSTATLDTASLQPRPGVSHSKDDCPVISNRVILCIANAWDDDPTSKHHVMRALAEHNDVLWINHRGIRRPKPTAADLRAGFHALRSVAGGLRRVAPRVAQLTPLIIPGARSRLITGWNRRLLLGAIRRALRKLAIGPSRPLQVWSFAPDLPDLIGTLNEECFVYYCTDDYARFDGHDADRIRAAEAETIGRADVVITTSQPLCDEKRKLRSDVHLVRHGVDVEHFARAWRNPPAFPGELSDRTGPVFGFFGLLHHWIDVDLLADVASRRPRYSFVLIGDCRTPVDRLRALSNVRLLGRRPYAQLPAYAAAFTAGLLPFRQTEMTRSINPVKMLEYLAAGLPIVSTPLPEAQRHTGTIRIADSPDAFARACDEVAENAPLLSRREISRLVEHESWTDRVEQLCRIVHQAVACREVTPTELPHAWTSTDEPSADTISSADAETDRSLTWTQPRPIASP